VPVGCTVGIGVGDPAMYVGTSVGAKVGLVGACVGDGEGELVGGELGAGVGLPRM